jgi:hypothetical protein
MFLSDKTSSFSEYNRSKYKAIVRIWSMNKPNVGHASLEIIDNENPNNRRYLSFWPSNALNPKKISKCSPAELSSLNIDNRAEGSEADIHHEIRDLNFNKILQEIDEIEQKVNNQKLQYLLSATNLNVTSSIETGNCCSVVLDTLRKGGLNVGGYLRSKTNFLISPSELNQLLINRYNYSNPSNPSRY